jgi:threonylcarbamoyladenosine tRNA methylthiotransferase MtaB
MATFHILNFGCRASQADGAALKQQLLRVGFEEATTLEDSSVTILNTCTVTASADAEVRQFVRRIHRRNPQCRILVTGCYAQRAPEEIAQMDGVAWVVGNSHKHLVTTLIAEGEYQQLEGKNWKPEISGASTQQPPLVQISGGLSTQRSESPAPKVLVGEITDEFHFAPVFADDRTRPTLKIQDGCDARCSFCIIPSVRGQSRSLPPQKVLEQVRQLVDDGYQEVVLSGINLGGYGRDLDRSINFLGIVERILSETPVARLRISSIELMDVDPALIRLVANEPRMAKHFHVPLQSGCDRILRFMNRRYWTRHYAERMLDIHEQIPNAALGADVMVGFPGETADDHAESLRFIASLPFTYLHIFPYSARPGTPAAAASGQVNGRIAKERSQEIRTLINAKHEAFVTAQVGQTLPALTLDETEEGARIALTTNYLKVVLPGVEIPANQVVDVSVGRAHAGRLYGYATTLLANSNLVTELTR